MVIVLGVVTPRHVVIMMGAREKKKQAKRKRLAEKLCVEDVKALGGSEVIDWGGGGCMWKERTTVDKP